jgi:signal peptidase II
VVLADQLSKEWIKTNLAVGQSLFDIGFFRIIHIYNTGAAFGLFQDHTLVLTIISSVAVIVLLFCGLSLQRYLPFLNNITGRVTLGLVLGGTAGNLIDRLHLGHVTDFIDFKVWPAFNIADSAVTVGVIMLAYWFLRMALAREH